MIIDQRHFFGASSVEKVHEAWADRLAGENGRRRRRQAPLAELVDRSHQLETLAYVNHSRWVVDCPVCGGGCITWPDHPRTCCLDCWIIFRPVHPSKARIAAALPLLLERPDPATRNWVHSSHRLVRDPKLLDAGRWFEDDAREVGDQWESVRRLRTENRLLGGLAGDGRGDERDLIATPGRLGAGTAPSIRDVTLPGGH